MANHNLNTEIPLGGSSLLVPTTTLLNETNAVSGYGSLGLSARDCRSQWGRAPNFLLVDYYEMGNFEGSVFEVAAEMNGVEYDPSKCCGQRLTNEGGMARGNGCGWLMLLMMIWCLGMWVW